MRQPAEILADPVVIELREALDRMYGDRLERVVLFGSRARGDAHSESDYDVAVFLKELANRRVEACRLADLSSDLIRRTGEVVNALPFPAGAYERRTPLMHELRREGIDLSVAGLAEPGTSYRGKDGVMQPETALYLRKARQCLEHGRAILGIGLGEDAGRDAYLAGFHAAQALIFERSGRAVKTHRGVRIQFEQLVPLEPGSDEEMRRLLGRSYDFKTIADYETSPDATVPLDEAGQALDLAERLIGWIEKLLGP
jgi:uncharacterized protein (UPF0332 family)/predicted nucleotidyltransferase